jgi:hypothetical protein
MWIQDHTLAMIVHQNKNEVMWCPNMKRRLFDLALCGGLQTVRK